MDDPNVQTAAQELSTTRRNARSVKHVLLENSSPMLVNKRRATVGRAKEGLFRRVKGPLYARTVPAVCTLTPRAFPSVKNARLENIRGGAKLPVLAVALLAKKGSTKTIPASPSACSAEKGLTHTQRGSQLAFHVQAVTSVSPEYQFHVLKGTSNEKTRMEIAKNVKRAAIWLSA